MLFLINKLYFTFCNKLPLVIDERIQINLLMYASETRSEHKKKNNDA